MTNIKLTEEQEKERLKQKVLDFSQRLRHLQLETGMKVDGYLNTTSKSIEAQVIIVEMADTEKDYLRTVLESPEKPKTDEGESKTEKTTDTSRKKK